MDYQFHLKKLLQKIETQDLIINEAIQQLDKLSSENEVLKSENNSLKELLTKTAGKSIRKTSRNSDRPPSTDLYRVKRTKSLRKKSNRKTGGQSGHEGHVLEWNSKPDKIIPSIPKKCLGCGGVLDIGLKELVFSKQEIDLPVVKPIVYQYNAYQIKCNCGKSTCGNVPSRLKAKVQYGPSVRSWINYLSVYQYLPYKRLQELLRIAFGLELSQGTIFNTLKRSAKKMKGLYNGIKDFLVSSEIVGADETIVFVKGKKWYNWVWQNRKATLISCEDSRRKDNIYNLFPHGFPNATLVSDRYSAHLSTPAKAHQICWVHILRHLLYLEETEPNDWIDKLRNLYKKAKHLQKLKSVNNRKSKKAKSIENKLNRLLLQEIDKQLFPETFTLSKSLIKNRDAILSFIYDARIPSHNNGSELAIRNAKIKMKISGGFRSGQKHYAIIRSIIDTLIKNNKNVFDSLLNFEQQKNIRLGF